ncbi:hypothetical protein GH714_025210 [Hevea brasiliensis]|uniref:Uncharacterized protein n=1 Tax=Hevea brasiliensis TaxID=3981 RepID=A0A6A6N1X1_HEVBR|nr:hypothetical protein GH714_025210 [Hevea brasiliensis]
MVADMFENIIWVTVPKVWNLRNLQLEISGQLPSNVIDSTNINSWELLMVLERMKFLLILHDVRQFISLEKVGIPRPTAENGCKIVLIARSEEVCDAMGVDSKIGLKDLSSWELFHGNVGEVADSSSLKPLATQVLNMCADYSLAIVLMAGALKDVSDVEDDKTRKCLRNYALFCENGWIASELLMQRWIFDGLIDAHDQGKKMLETLINFSLLDYEQEIEFVKMKKKIRYILLEYIVPTEEAQVLFLINGGMGLTKPPKVEQWEGLIEICLMDNDISELPISPSCPKLRKSFLERNYKLRIITPSFFDNMPALQVLNLSRTSIKSLPESLFKLFNLRRLFLNRCVLITTLSPEVGELKQLEVLDLEGTEIMILPKEVGQLTNLTCLEISFFEPTSRRSLKQSREIIPCGAISALYLLEELNIDTSYDDKRWNASAEEVISELCRLQWLHTLKVYLPKVEFLSYFNWMKKKMVFPSLSYFKFTVGHHVEHIISRLSSDTELELERHDRYLRYVNGEGAGDIKKVLRHSTALFLDRNSTISKLSDFGCRNMMQLKCLVAGQCNNLQAIIDGNQIESSSSDATVGLISLEYMHIYYMKNLSSIWEGPVNNSSFNLLKYLILRKCPELTNVFTPGLLANFSNLEELTIHDCPKITSLVSCYNCDDKITLILPALKRISLHFLPKLISISNALLISPRLELMSFQYCLNLKSLPISKAFNENLRKIKGEHSWWQELKWEGTHHDSWADIFFPID